MRRLRLIEGGNANGAQASRWLKPKPYRPGELHELQRLDLTLDSAAMRALSRHSAAAGVSGNLWLRVAVEASRQLEQLARSAMARVMLVERLDAISAIAPSSAAPAADPEEAALCEYAALIRRAQTRTAAVLRCSAQRRLMLPRALVRAWSHAAAGVQRDIGLWASAHALRAPDSVLLWEAASAEDALSLDEWIECHVGLARI